MRLRFRTGPRFPRPLVPRSARYVTAYPQAYQVTFAFGTYYIDQSGLARDRKPYMTRIEDYVTKRHDPHAAEQTAGAATRGAQSSAPTAAQADMTFNVIACNANLIAGLLARLRRQAGSQYEAMSADLSIAEALVTQIGALADEMSGGQLRGSLASWVVGPRFENT